MLFIEADTACYITITIDGKTEVPADVKIFQRADCICRPEKLIAGCDDFLLQYPSTVSSELLPDRGEPNDPDGTPPGTLPADADISPAARDLLKRLLQPEPRLRLRSLLSLQRIAFYMGHDLQSYMLKKAKIYIVHFSRPAVSYKVAR